MVFLNGMYVGGRGHCVVLSRGEKQVKFKGLIWKIILYPSTKICALTRAGGLKSHHFPPPTVWSVIGASHCTDSKGNQQENEGYWNTLLKSLP